MPDNHKEIMIDEHDRLFNYLSARIQNREGASLSLVGLAASASLVFLGLIFVNGNFNWEFFIIGIIFPALAFAYNEVTNRGLHKDDQKVINDLIKNTDEEKWKKEIEDIIINKKNRLPRLVLMRFTLLSPILGWLLMLPIEFELNLVNKIIYDIISGVGIFLISLWVGYTNKIKY